MAFSVLLGIVTGFVTMTIKSNLPADSLVDDEGESYKQEPMVGNLFTW